MAVNTDSWGRLDRRPRTIADFATDRLRESALPFGNGRSYGDTCHNDPGTLLDSRSAHAILGFDRESGTLSVQSGAILGDVLNALEGSGWFMPVVPGTRFVTMGGMLANDIHGKNHCKAGTFGRHITRFTLHRSDAVPQVCEPGDPLFAATVGGMGLTGFVTDLDVQLMRVPSAHVRETKHAFSSIAEALDLMAVADAANEYAVGWVDSLGTGKTFGRGILITGDHVAHDEPATYGKPRLSIPFTPPLPLVVGPALKAFNEAYFRAGARSQPRVAPPSSFFFPLDAVGSWNRLYGPRGLHQHQCVLPSGGAAELVEQMLRMAQDAGHGSFLTVLKRFGNLRSPGIASFPMPGVTLTLDFAARGASTLALLDALDALVIGAGGRTNPYKDARMSAATYRAGFPRWRELEAARDPAISSNFWRRVASGRSVCAPPLAPVNPALEPAVQPHSVEPASKESQ